MKYSHRWVAIALMACASFVCSGFAAVQTAVVSAYSWAKKLVLDGFKLAAGETSDLSPVSIRQVQAKAFVLRLVKRERPVLTASWRMCPST